MLSANLFVVEMTGIFGAGYLPGLFQPLTRLLRDDYQILDQKTPRCIVTRFHVDDLAARAEDPGKERRATELINRANKADTMAEADRGELFALLRDADQRFLADLTAYPKAVDIAFRRGGRLQDHILLYREPHQVDRIGRDSRTAPKLQVFLRATLDTVRETYSNPYIQQLIQQNPGVYNDTPEEAFNQQEIWHGRVRHFTHQIDRTYGTATEFARQIIDDLVPILRGFRVRLQSSPPLVDLFLSYASEDQEVARNLADALQRHGVRLWYDRLNVKVGDSIAEKLQEGLALAKHGAVILSPRYLERPWGSWAKRELEGFFVRAVDRKRFILPIWLGVTRNEVAKFMPSLAGIHAIDASTLSVQDVAVELAAAVKEET